MSARAELHSMATSLDELVRHLASVTESLDANERDLVGPDLFEVERALRSARRGLSRIVDSASP
jgi:hypothetical protein